MRGLGNELRFHEPDVPWAGWHSEGRARPLFVIHKPYDGEAHLPGNGQMFAFSASSRELVRTVHRIGLQHGGLSEGEPGLRPNYHANYYGAYLRDPEGNKLGIACHAQQVATQQ